MQLVSQNARWIGLVLFSLLNGVRAPKCEAVPLMLRGTATVATVVDDFDYEGTVRRLPFATHLGETFNFLLSVESQVPAPEQTSGFAPSGFATFQSTIGGVHLQHSHLEVHVTNDWGVDELFLAAPGIADTAAIVGDRILVRKPYQLGATEFVGTASVVGAPGFGLNLGFLQYVAQNLLEGSPQIFPTILNNLSVPQDGLSWQAFSHREIAFWFENRTFVGAHINDIVAIPEPSALLICGYCCLSWSGSALARRRPRLGLSKWPRRDYAESSFKNHRSFIQR